MLSFEFLSKTIGFLLIIIIFWIDVMNSSGEDTEGKRKWNDDDDDDVE